MLICVLTGARLPGDLLEWENEMNLYLQIISKVGNPLVDNGEFIEFEFNKETVSNSNRNLDRDLFQHHKNHVRYNIKFLNVEKL